jgi:hypothetical protein
MTLSDRCKEESAVTQATPDGRLPAIGLTSARGVSLPEVFLVPSRGGMEDLFGRLERKLAGLESTVAALQRKVRWMVGLTTAAIMVAAVVAFMRATPEAQPAPIASREAPACTDATAAIAFADEPPKPKESSERAGLDSRSPAPARAAALGRGVKPALHGKSRTPGHDQGLGVATDAPPAGAPSYDFAEEPAVAPAQ